MSLNDKKKIFKLGDTEIKCVDVEDGTIGWEQVDLQAYFSDGALDEFEYNSFLEPGTKTNTAAAKNMFVYLQSIYNKLKNIDDGTYPAGITAYIDESDCWTEGTATVSWSAYYNNPAICKVCNINASFVVQNGDGVQTLYYIFSIRRLQYKDGKVSYIADITYNTAGPTNLGSTVDTHSESAAISAQAENVKGDLVEYENTGVVATGFKSISTGGCDPEIDSFYSSNLTLYEK